MRNDNMISKGMGILGVFLVNPSDRQLHAAVTRVPLKECRIMPGTLPHPEPEKETMK
jgi:hypothetical protein